MLGCLVVKYQLSHISESMHLHAFVLIFLRHLTLESPTTV